MEFEPRFEPEARFGYSSGGSVRCGEAKGSDFTLFTYWPKRGGCRCSKEGAASKTVKWPVVSGSVACVKSLVELDAKDIEDTGFGEDHGDAQDCLADGTVYTTKSKWAGRVGTGPTGYENCQEACEHSRPGISYVEPWFDLFRFRFLVQMLLSGPIILCDPGSIDK